MIELEILREFEELGKLAHLEDYAIPKNLIIDTKKWTSDEGLVTASGKLNRTKILAKYKLQIDIVYSKISNH